jgi:hypothetical protein
MEQSPSWEANRSSASQKIPAFYGTRIFITAFTSARQLSLSLTRSIRSIPPHSTSWRSVLILSFHLRLGLPSGLFKRTCPVQAPNIPRTESHLPFPLLRSYQSISAGSRNVFIFPKKFRFLARCRQHIAKPPKLDDRHLSAVGNCLLRIFPATIHIGGRSSTRVFFAHKHLINLRYLTDPIPVWCVLICVQGDYY